jgi:DNA-binding transcriptional LysR family regulator
MDLWQLNIFCSVVDLKSFSKAGKKVHISQPTVSTHIKDLETHFGCRLIDRLSKEAVPTKAGELLYAHARRMLALLDETEMALAEFQGKISGRLTAGGSTIPGVYMLPRMVGAFVKIYPDVTISLNIGDTAEIVENVASGRLELGIVGAETNNRQVNQEKLTSDELCLVTAPDPEWQARKQISLDAMCELPFIIREPGSGTLKSIRRSLIQRDKDIDALKVAAEMDTAGAVIQAVKHRVGVSILSRLAVADELASGALCGLKVEGLNLNRYFYLTVHAFRTLSPLADTFKRFLMKEFKADE